MQTVPRHQRVTRLIYPILFVMLLGGILLGWGAFRVVAFVKDLPNRIAFQIDGEAISTILRDSLRHALREGNDEQRLEVLRHLAAGPLEDAEYRVFVDTECGALIEDLVGSPNLAIASEAVRLQAAIGMTPNSNR